MRLVSVSIQEASRIAEARRLAAAAAAAAGFSETDAGRLALIVTEAGTNMYRHAGGGEILIQPVRDSNSAVIEVLALDTGPGMRDVAQCLADGYSTAGGSGTGLGAIRRLSNQFDIYSVTGKGTAILARVWPHSLPRPAPPALEIAGISVPKPGEEVCGDDWAVRHSHRATLLLVVDGLGHGLPAADAAARAVASFADADAPEEPADTLEWLHAGLRGTRGAAAAVAHLDPLYRRVRFAGIGNIGAMVLSPHASRQMVSHTGIVGHQVRNVHEFTYEWPARALIVLYSDGLSTHCSLESYPGLAERQPALIAAVLYRDFRRGRDDATVVVVRERGGTTGSIST